MRLKNKVQLITYPDSLGGDLKQLHRVLEEDLTDLFEGGVHILPPFPSSGDRGFAPTNYMEIDPAFGTWEDIERIASSRGVMVDLMVNHISQSSAYFQDYLKKGRASEYADMFLTMKKIWPNGIPKQEDMDKIFLRRPVPYSTFSVPEEGEVQVWTTFGSTDPSEQIDLDVNAPVTRQLLTEWLQNFAEHGINMVRLDAIGYVVKKPGTSFFFVEPEIYTFLQWLRELAHDQEMEMLPEVHAHYELQYALAEHGYWIYDFILPYRILEASIQTDSSSLLAYLKDRPVKQFTMLDCHDGVPVIPDLNDLLDVRRAQEVVAVCLERGARVHRILSDEHKGPDGFDVHQILGTYYDLLGRNDDAYIAARAIQLFTPGIPQVYYVGLLAGINDPAAAEATGELRELNRHNYTRKEVRQQLDRKVVQRLQRLIRFRNRHPAFDGQFSILPGTPQEVNLQWLQGDDICRLRVNLETQQTEIVYLVENGREETYIA